MPANPNVNLLAIDTATEHMAIGLETPGGRWLHNAPGGAQASANLLSAVADLLARAGIGYPGLSAIAFGQGPGAFTGLRTACAVAQGLAFGVGKPVLAIDSLMVVAEDAHLQSGLTGSEALCDWWVAVDARMDEVYAAHFQRRPDGWQVLASAQLFSVAALAQVWAAQPPVRVAGNACSVFADRLPLARAQCWPDQADRAAALLNLARQAWLSGRTLAPAQALPVYVRDKVALTTDERAAKASAA